MKGHVREALADERLIVRQFRFEDNADVQRIFREGMLEMIPDTAFRALRHHPESLLLYLFMLILSFLLTESLIFTCCVPLLVLLARYHYSRQVILRCLERTQNTDMSDIEKYYLKSPGSGFWVAVLEGRVVGIVAVKPHGTDSLELLRMSVDHHCRKGGVGSTLGRTVLEFARQFAHTALSTSSFSVILGTTAYTPAAHRLYWSLGFCHVGTTEGYTIPGDDGPIWQWLFYRVRHHHYRLEIK
ncbi:N-acetylaspartate synthetase-like [Hemibagrus wyckioides]|uniref:N-acetylaspartate synthetase-like n=1 Tax=Hemibagrus wyckioides TaxID=337641 RepID=UPI00266C2D48|nr:N-acetylaspartate synthetase-like [Hemibagrus wyckioides]XP_058242526.1 N-acetylaspartate synthetase-like [Hemibagrus wyckioides]